jgi:thioredoxin-related protein
MPADNHIPAENAASRPASGAANPKKSKAVWFFIIPVVAFMLVLFFVKKERPIAWVPDLKTAEELAKKQNKPVMLSFYTVESDHCIDMKQNTYNNKTAVQFVEKNFVPVLIDTEKNPALVQKYHITVFPTQVIYLMSDPQKFALVPGRHPSSNFIDRLTKALAKLNLTPKS